MNASVNQFVTHYISPLTDAVAQHAGRITRPFTRPFTRAPHVFASITCQHVGTMLADYWSGHHLAHVAVPVDAGTTFDDLHDMILAELLEGAIMGSSPLADTLRGLDDHPGYDNDTRTDLTQIAAHVAVLRDIQPATPGGRPFPNLPSADDADADLFNGEGAYAYFVFVQND